MIISISGVPGSGKTSVAKLLAKHFGFPFYSMGDLRGKMAQERGMTIAELNKLGEQNPNTDAPVDEYQKELGQKADNVVIEGRLSWFFIPHSFKILLLCDEKEAAERVYVAGLSEAERQRDEPIYHSPEEAETKLAERVASDHVRYKKYYKMDNYLDRAHYDLVLDTTASPGPEQTVKKILEKLTLRGF